MKNEHSTLPEKIAPGETLAEVQLCPFGEFPNGKTMQVCDEVAFNKIASAFAADGAREILCDFEHKSEDPSLTSDTVAANKEKAEADYIPKLATLPTNDHRWGDFQIWGFENCICDFSIYDCMEAGHWSSVQRPMTKDR